MRESGFPGPDVEELSDPHCCNTKISAGNSRNRRRKSKQTDKQKKGKVWNEEQEENIHTN